MSKKLLALGIAAVMAVSAVGLTGCGGKNSDSSVAEDTKIYTPTFMYFVSASDENFDAEKALFEELQKEYDGQVNFALHNIDETPEDKDNFPVEGQTPALIMLNINNNISAMEFQCSDKETLEKRINEALSGEQPE